MSRTEKYRAAEIEARELLADGWVVERQADATSNDPDDDAHLLSIWREHDNEDGSSWQVYDQVDEIDLGTGRGRRTGWVATWQPGGDPDLENEKTADTLEGVLRVAGLARPG